MKLRNLEWLLLLEIMAVLLCGCQANPRQDVVVSKNDGIFEDRIHNVATNVDPEKYNHIENVQYSEEFHSTDGSVNFFLHVDQLINQTVLPVVEVSPHFFTGRDVQNVVQAIFRDATIFEQEPSVNPQYSKSQLLRKIEFWSKYANERELKEQLGYYDPSDLDRIKEIIQEYTVKLESAPDSNPHKLCDWQFRPEEYYLGTSYGNEIILATVSTKNAEYQISAVTRNRDDYKLNGITIGLGSGHDLVNFERTFYRAELCRTEKPSSDQISAAERKAQDMLDNMGLGTWRVKEGYIETVLYGDITEYTIRVDAVPILAGAPAHDEQIINNLTENIYSSCYYMTHAFFQFSSNGELVFFGLDSPVDINKIVNECVQTYSLDELVAMAKSHLSLSDAKAEYGIPSGFYQLYADRFNEELTCQITISEIGYGLARIKVPDADNIYYYVPTLTLIGESEYYGKESGKHYLSSNDFMEGNQPLIWINAVDGSIIEH